MTALPTIEIETPVTHAEIDGIQMGILADGTPYLTTRALARISGQSPSVIGKLSRDWASERHKPRGRKINSLLALHGYSGDAILLGVEIAGKPVHVLPDAVCMAILEYYAFEADSSTRHIAQESYRLLARHSLRRFIYGHVGYEPRGQFSDTWKHFHDRMVLNPVPSGYFGLLREIADILVPAMELGLALGPRTMPDISVGLAWGKFWTDGDLDDVYGPRLKHPHRFPADFPQTEPVEAWIYPIEALGEFRSWMRDHYLPGRFRAYLENKARSGALPYQRVDNLLEAVNSNAIVAGD